MLPLSVLDLSPVTSAGSGPVALRNTLDLSRHADRLGYTRYWVAEHHNLPNIASAAPEVMIGQIAAATSHLRVGAGGVMLPNHAPLMVAERYKVLEGLFPGRIDLGLGRAPGTDPVASYALRRRQETNVEDDFLERLQELMLLDSGGFPEGHPFRRITVMPRDVSLPPIWLLGSSGYSAELAGAIGTGFAFAHHFADYDAVAALRSYRQRFRPSGRIPAPYAILTVHVVCAETDAEAETLAASVDLNFVRRAKGEYLPLASPEEALAYPYSPADRERMRYNRNRLFVGSPSTLHERLSAFVQATAADEVMITSMIYDHGARKRSYELMAQAFGLGATEGSLSPDLAAAPA